MTLALNRSSAIWFPGERHRMKKEPKRLPLKVKQALHRAVKARAGQLGMKLQNCADEIVEAGLKIGLEPDQAKRFD